MNDFPYAIEKCCCFTGHRPKKLKNNEQIIREKLKEKITEAISRGFTTFITGMAQGVDLQAAEIVLDMKKVRPDINLVCAFPFCKKWLSREEQTIKDGADFSVIVSENYSRACFIVRDRWMVDRSSLVIAVFNGSSGGTAFTIGYAKEHGRKISLIDDSLDLSENS